MIKYALYGELSEWFKELVLKTSDTATYRGFESHTLRQKSSYSIRGMRIFIEDRDSKDRPDRRKGKKQSGGLFLRSWENPCASGRIHMDVDGCT